MAAQALGRCQRGGVLQIRKRQQLATQRVFQRQQATAGKVHVVRFDGRFNVRQGQAAVALMVQWLRLHAAEHGRTTTFPAVGVCHLADDVLVAALAVTEDGAQVALGPGRHKHRGLKPQQVGDLGLQCIDARVIAEHVVAQGGRLHGCTHRRSGPGDGVTAQIDYFFSHFSP